MENAGDFQAGSSANLPAATSSALEQHIASVREALGVESYYSRQVVHRPQTVSGLLCFVSVLVKLDLRSGIHTSVLSPFTAVTAEKGVRLRGANPSLLCLFFLVVSFQTGEGPHRRRPSLRRVCGLFKNKWDFEFNIPANEN